MSGLPTPDEWNATHRPPPVDDREFAPVSCPRCGSRMFFPWRDADHDDRVVRCASKSHCIQTTIRNPLYTSK